MSENPPSQSAGPEGPKTYVEVGPKGEEGPYGPRDIPGMECPPDRLPNGELKPVPLSARLPGGAIPRVCGTCGRAILWNGESWMHVGTGVDHPVMIWTAADEKDLVDLSLGADWDSPENPLPKTGTVCCVCGKNVSEAVRFDRGNPLGVTPALWHCPTHDKKLLESVPGYMKPIPEHEHVSGTFLATPEGGYWLPDAGAGPLTDEVVKPGPYEMGSPGQLGMPGMGPGTDMRELARGEIMRATDVFSDGERIPSEWIGKTVKADGVFRGVPLGEEKGVEGQPGARLLESCDIVQATDLTENSSGIMDTVPSVWIGAAVGDERIYRPVSSAPPGWFASALAEARASDLYDAGHSLAKCSNCGGLLYQKEGDWFHDGPPCVGGASPKDVLNGSGPVKCSSSIDRRSRWSLFLAYLFPTRHVDVPSAPANWEDVIHFNGVTELSWLDRLRVVLVGKLAFTGKIVCEHAVGDTLTNMDVSVPAPGTVRPIKEARAVPMVAEDTPGMHTNPDAVAWAKFFVKTMREVAERNLDDNPKLTESEILREIGVQAQDQGYMMSWFANAMMAMHDFLRKKESSSAMMPGGLVVVLSIGLVVGFVCGLTVFFTQRVP